MAKGVLGNDPFQRGAADRAPPDAAKPAQGKKPARGTKPAAAKRGAAQGATAKGGKRSAAKPATAGAAKRAPKAPRAASKKPPTPKPPTSQRRPTGTLSSGSQEALTDAQLAAAQALAQVPPGTEILDPELPSPAHRQPAPSVPPEQHNAPFEAASPQPVQSRDEPGPEQAAAPAPHRAQEEAYGTVSLALSGEASSYQGQARRVHQAATLSERASGALRLARDMAVQALASEGVGKALGVAQGLFGAVRAGLGTGGSSSLDLYGKDPALVDDLRPVLDFLYERYWRVTVQGAELIPEGPCILVANHSGALPFDGPVMQLVLGRERPDLAESRWLVEDQVFHAPMLGTLFNRLGAVRACQENAERLLSEGRPVVVFPEGIQGLSKPFAQRYQLKRFGRGGFVKLALRTGAPIVPVAIVGAEESSPLLARLPGGLLGLPYLPLTPLGPLPLPARWSIRFGAPLELGDLGPVGAEDLSEVQRLTERTRESIQGMLQALLLQRRSVFAG